MKYLFSFLACVLVLGAGCSPVQQTSSLHDITERSTLKAPTPITTPTPQPTVQTQTQTQSMNTYTFPGILPESETNMNVRIKTTKGDIVFELLPSEGLNAASNFVYLTKEQFYDGLSFHRVEPNFVIQGGDPLGNGRGGPGYQFKNDSVNLSYERGIVAMANAGVDTNGSQFFIMLQQTPLPPSYSIFGRVIEGMDVVDQIRVGDVMTAVTLEPKS